MSQFPPQPPQGSPYSPPPSPSQYPQVNYYAYPYPQSDPLVPAKRASILMFILGGIMLVCGGLCGLMSLVDPSEFAASPDLQQVEAQLQSGGASIRAVFVVMTAMMFIPGLVMVVLGLLVRRGGIGSVVTSIVLVGLLILGNGLIVLSGLVRESPAGPAQQLVGVLMFGVPLALLVLLLVWLIQAAKASGQIAQMRAAYQAQYWQYQQSQMQQQPPPPPPPPPQGQ